MSTETRLDPAGLRDNQFAGRTDHLPRPSEADRGYGWSRGAEQLRQDQSRWDFAKAWQAENARIRADRFAAIEAKREAERDARRQEAATVVLDELRGRYLKSDPLATAEDFEADKVELLRQRRIAAALEEPTKVGRRG